MIIRIKGLDNRTIASADSAIEGRWSWIQHVIARQFDCDPDDVGVTDDEEYLDLVLVRGEPVARIVKS